MNNIESKIYKSVYICTQNKKVYLINKLTEPISELIYSTFSMLTTDDQIGISDAPHYKIQNIPAGQAVYVETLDGWEDGSIYYQLQSIKTASFSDENAFTLNQKSLSGMITLPTLANCVVEKIAADKGFIVNTNTNNDKAMNELYWLAEDLKAYTDLTGSHFDTEKAQVKLWKMNPILSKNDFPKIQKLQNNLLGQLEIPMAFDKAEFSEKVDELYAYLEELKK